MAEAQSLFNLTFIQNNRITPSPARPSPFLLSLISAPFLPLASNLAASQIALPAARDFPDQK